MALKIKFDRAHVDITSSGEATCMVYFSARDDAAVGKLKDGVQDAVYLTPSFPMTKAGLRDEAVNAIKAKYTGAVEE